ncbi:hypothetical protein Q8G38_05510 [Halomonas venusta]|uniref:hypothetical protein n=1 Tax=Vreelandella venusta TaxID=44935 RepID=UPI00295ED398|nr:hypothetical protein [Halomonas venusta]MDW0358772.1 hypothetical protein [Halomonas venusta]
MAKAPIQVVWFKRDMRMNHDLSLKHSLSSIFKPKKPAPANSFHCLAMTGLMMLRRTV